MRRLAAALGIALALTMSSTASAQTDTTTTSLLQSDGFSKSIIPQPNSGSKPQQMGDRGGAGQLALLGILVAAMTGLGVVVVRSTRRNDQARDTSGEKKEPPTPRGAPGAL